MTKREILSILVICCVCFFRFLITINHNTFKTSQSRILISLYKTLILFMYKTRKEICQFYCHLHNVLVSLLEFDLNILSIPTVQAHTSLQLIGLTLSVSYIARVFIYLYIQTLNELALYTLRLCCFVLFFIYFYFTTNQAIKLI